MKTKLLKRIRKAYAYRYDRDKEMWIICNHKEQCSYKYHSVREFLTTYVYDRFGIASGINYELAYRKRQQKATYDRLLKTINP